MNDTELLSHFTNFDQEYSNKILEVIQSRKNDIEKYLLKKYNSRNNKLLETFDWDVKWMLGNNSLASQRTIFASLYLNCREGDSNTKMNMISMEMDKNDVDNLINLLENTLETMES